MRVMGSFRPSPCGVLKAQRAVMQPRLARSARLQCMAQQKEKVVAVLYKAGEAAENKDLLGCVENELGLRKFIEDQGHEYIVTDSKEGDGNELDKHLKDATILISTPFHPAYLTKERVEAAKNLKLSITAGVGSDHVDLHAAADAGMTVAEVTGSNVVSVAEHNVMLILTMLRNFLPAHEQIASGGWDVGAAAQKAYDLENKVVGIAGAGRIGQLTMERLKGFGLKELRYFDYKHLPEEKEKELNAKFAELDDLIHNADVISVSLPLTDKTKGMFNDDVIGKMKKGAILINTARGAIADTDAVARALESGQLGGYAGDVWPEQPAPKDHPWRTAPNNGMTPHYSGTTLDAQARYADGTKKMLDAWFKGEAFEDSWYIVREGELAPQYK
eukprot:jgi/Astpho2/2127/Aster-00603